METLAVKSQINNSFSSLTLDEVDRLNELLLDAEAILGAFTVIDTENTEIFEIGYLIRLADKGVDALREAYKIINKE